jgi:hypothetical protein
LNSSGDSSKFFSIYLKKQEARAKRLTGRKRFSIMATDMLGFAEIPSGAKGTCKNTFSFTGQTSSGGIDKVDFNLDLPGRYSGDFDLHADPGIFSWSPCDGSTAILNMNTQCSISPTSQSALIAVCPFQEHPDEEEEEEDVGKPHDSDAHDSIVLESSSSSSSSSSSTAKTRKEKKKDGEKGKKSKDCEAWARDVMRKTDGWQGENVAKLGKQVDHVSGKLTVRFRLSWRPCSFRP